MTDNSLSDKIMHRAVALATAAGAAGEVPVAAIITDPDGQIIAEAVNTMQETGQATAHAEMALCNWRWQKQARLVCQIMIFGSPWSHVPCVPVPSAMRALAPPLFRGV